MTNKTLKLYDRVTGRQVAEESIDKLKRLPTNEVLEFFKLQRLLGREWDCNIINLIE